MYQGNVTMMYTREREARRQRDPECQRREVNDERGEAEFPVIGFVTAETMVAFLEVEFPGKNGCSRTAITIAFDKHSRTRAVFHCAKLVVVQRTR